MMNKLTKMRKRKGFTLIELVIVVAIIGILSLMILPQFNNVTSDAKVKTFESNCQTVTSAIGMYQAGNDGEYPGSTDELKPYINGGWDSLTDNPKGASYSYDPGTKTFTASYTDDKGTSHTYTYPTP